LLRSPVAVEGEGGAVSAELKESKGHYVMLRDQVKDLVLLPTSRANEPGSTNAGYGDCLNDAVARINTGSARKDVITLPTPNASDVGRVRDLENRLEKGSQMDLGDAVRLLPTPAVGHIRNNDEPIENYLQRREDYLEGRTSGMPGASLGVAIRMELFTTPIASEGLKASAAQSSEEREKTGQVFLTNEAHDLAVENGLPVPPRLLPTPIASDSKGTGPGDANRVTTQLRAITHLLPTVTTQESKSGPSQLLRNTPPLNAVLPEMVANGEIQLIGTPRASSAKGSTQKQVDAEAPKSRIEDQVLISSWGKYEPAVRRWEYVLGTSAPAPTNPDGKNGAHRLAPEFVEWMMGLPEGWVTDPEIGLKRNDQLKALGNGVVPQQALMALQILLDEETLEKIGKK